MSYCSEEKKHVNRAESLSAHRLFVDFEIGANFRLPGRQSTTLCYVIHQHIMTLVTGRTQDGMVDRIAQLKRAVYFQKLATFIRISFYLVGEVVGRGT